MRLFQSHLVPICLSVVLAILSQARHLNSHLKKIVQNYFDSFGVYRQQQCEARIIYSRFKQQRAEWK